MENIISTNNMKTSDFKNLTKSQLISLLIKQNLEIKKLLQQNIQQQPIPTPRKSVKQMVQDYEDNIIEPPLEFRDDYKPTPKPRTKKPTPLPRTKIEEKAQAMKGYTKSYEINIKNNKDPLEQLKNTRKAIENHIKNIIKSKKGLKAVETLKVTFTKMSGEELIYKSAYFNSKPQTIINNTEIYGSLQLSEQQILNLVAQWISEGSGWTVESVENHYINVVQYEPLKGSSYIKLPQELKKNGTQAVKMPQKGNNILKYNNFHKQQQVPFVIYADFEAITEKISGCHPNNNKSYTEAYQKHTDCGFGYKLVCCYDDKYSKPLIMYRGEKAVYEFMEQMLKEVKYCKNVMKKEFNKPLKMTKKDEDKFKKAEECYICNKKYTNEDIRVRDHCHITGNYRGSAHQECNLKLRVNPEQLKIPVIFHNLRGYDSHFIMQEIGEIVKNNTYTKKNGEKCQMNINAIPNNMEKYMAFMLGNHLTFIDSFQFMSSSLEKLVSNLPKETLKYTSQRFKGDKFDLMIRKGVYPYDYMDSFDKFEDTVLPTKDQFYSLLNDEHISDEDYNHAQKVWKTLSMNNMGDYHDLYLQSDILLLADVFENFRKTCLEYYKLDPCHYFTSPGLSWDAMLKMTDIKLELMTDIDMFQFIEKGLRGGISYIANRYGKANNKYMKDYNENTPSKYIMYLDANNLYGWAMSQYLPTGGFKWMKQDHIDKLDLGKYKEDSKKGLILEVDLEYPKELHDLHNDYPLGPEKVKVTEDMLSDYCKKIAEKYGISVGLVSKLIPTLGNKEKYVLHYRNLKLYMNLGLKVTKVHRVLKYDQSPWLKQYFDFNTEKRKNAKNAFEKDFFKLMNNSVFGKTMENIRKRVDVRLVTDEKKQASQLLLAVRSSMKI